MFRVCNACGAFDIDEYHGCAGKAAAPSAYEYVSLKTGSQLSDEPAPVAEVGAREFFSRNSFEELIQDDWFVDNPNGRDIREELNKMLNAYDAVVKERDEWKRNAEHHAAYINKLLDQIVKLERECGREPGDY